MLGFAVLVACGGADDEPEDDELFADFDDRSEFYDGLDDAEAVAAVFVDAYCDTAWECYSESAVVADEAKFLFGRYFSPDHCRETAGEAVDAEGFEAMIAPAVDAGRMRVDPAAAEDCRRQLRQRMCREGFDAAMVDFPSDCEQFFGGQLGEGHDCTVPLECEESMTCRRDGEDCTGRCAPSPDPESCGDQTCGDDEYCALQVDHQAGVIDYSCESRLEEGQNCHDSAHCEEGLACITHICQQLQVRQENDQCVMGSTGSHCEPGTVCTPHPDADNRADATCSSPGTEPAPCFDFTGCAPDHFCDLDDGDYLGECRRLGEIGDDCEDHHHCASGYCKITDGEGSCTERDLEICVHPDDE